MLFHSRITKCPVLDPMFKFLRNIRVPIKPADLLLQKRRRYFGFFCTKLQPGIDLLRDAKDFPKDGSILIITDGMIEDKLHISRDHAFLLPAGGHLHFPVQ